MREELPRPEPPEGRKTSILVDETGSELRLDSVLANRLEDVSRAQVKRWIDEGRVRVGGRPARASRICRAGDLVEVVVPPPAPAIPQPEPIPLDVLYEDSDLIVINKRPGMVVHPGPGHPSGTLVNALLAHARDLSGIGGVLRPGIVHRLDAGTSGVMVVAKNDRSHRHLQTQFQRREVEKIYVALVYGKTRERFTVNTAIGRDRRHRTKISSRTQAPREATSEVARVETLPLSSLLSIRIRTGRTHQIRVHLSEAGHPVVGDRHYGAPRRGARAPSRDAAAFRLLRDFSRPALHARALGLRHPRTDEPMGWEAPLAEDLQELLIRLRELAATCAS